MIKIFVLASGRSGTKYLSELFEHNVKKCVTKHEPYLGMFGKPIYWYQEGNIEKIRKRFALKKKIIDRYRADVYIETNHAFLKSFSDVAMETFQDMKLIHLIRNPLEVTKSQHNRPVWVGEPGLTRFRMPLYSYRSSDGKTYLDWTLTGKEPIFQDIDIALTRYQRLLAQWIELENRAMNFLKKYNKYGDCYTLETPKDLNNEIKIRDMFQFLGVKLKQENLHFQGKKNTAKTPTVVTEVEQKQSKELMEHLPDRYLAIFHHEPYVHFEWSSLLAK